MEKLKIYKKKREIMEEFNLGFTDYKAFKRLLDRGDVYEVFYGDKVGYVIFGEIADWIHQELLKRCGKTLRNS